MTDVVRGSAEAVRLSRLRRIKAIAHSARHMPAYKSLRRAATATSTIVEQEMLSQGMLCITHCQASHVWPCGWEAGHDMFSNKLTGRAESRPPPAFCSWSKRCQRPSSARSSSTAGPKLKPSKSPCRGSMLWICLFHCEKVKKSGSCQGQTTHCM